MEKNELSDEEKTVALGRIERLIKRLKDFNISEIEDFGNSKIHILEADIDKALRDTFEDGVEYERYEYIKYLGPDSVNFYEQTPAQEVRVQLKKKIDRAILQFESINDNFNFELNESKKGTPTRLLSSYQGLKLHERISQASDKLYRDGHYANAVEDAVKALIKYVKEKSGADEDGKNLMQHVPSKNRPVLKFNELKTESDKNEQEGYMYLFTGAVVGFRNPRVDDLKTDDPETALEMIAFISFLSKLVDRANRE